MQRMSLAKLLSILGTALAISGCNGRQLHVQSTMPPPVTAAVTPVPLFVPEAEAALARSDFAASVSFAELAVRAQPTDPRPRTLLAQAYLGGGRVVAAEQTYGDLLDQTPGNPKARLGRALARLAGGNPHGAVADLDTLTDAAMLPDVGLAYALAGESGRGVGLLTTAARLADATPRIRQNLALALALDGQWARARVVAAQDLDPPAVDERIRQWTALAANPDPASRTATILAIVPRVGDLGRPSSLAWAVPAGPQGAAVAEARVVTVMARQPDQPALSPAATLFAVSEREQEQEQEPVGRWVVQLGAYATETQRDAAWTRLKSGGIAAQVRSFEPVNTQVVTPTHGVLHRLSIGNFADRQGAGRVCEALRMAGAACLVRDIGPVAPTQLAARL